MELPKISLRFVLLLLSYALFWLVRTIITQAKYDNMYSYSTITTITLLIVLFLIMIIIILMIKPYLTNSSIYLVDFSCFKPPNFCRVPLSTFLENASKIESFDDESLAFMAKILSSSGLSEETCLPPPLHYIPPRHHHQNSIKEAQMVLFATMDDLLAKTKLSPREIDILIVNCSGFCPSPSLSSIVINRYSMRSDVKSFNISGMGCSGSALAVDLARNILKTRRVSNAVVMSTEILSEGWYSGREKPMLLVNCLFRMGSSAILLSNKRVSKEASKYELVEALRMQRAFDDEAYHSAIREEDMEGNLGVTLTRDLLRVAGETLRSNITSLGPSILPLKEKLRYGVSALLLNKAYVPDFKSVIDHFCLPSSSRMIIREVAKGLGLGERDIEPALMTLHRFGNQSSSSLWYELGYLESKERVKEGDLVWQIGMGSGPKCVSLVWKCLRPIVGEPNKGPWTDCIHHYPIVSL